ncbi:MAG: murein biosynthesis integral membrane protein MurJ [Gammaproteobacteria bacterium TMED112]|nr:MAG: murein biosynthesis integral membrane protein MurJ [Gammaproteobacteria bacterium TMED112]
MNISNFWKSSFGFSFFTLISRIFGYIRDLAFSSILGANVIHDIFVVIFKIPNVFRSFFGEGALSQSLTPSIIEAKENLNNFLNQIFTMLFFALLSFVLFVELFPELFVSIFAPGFQTDENKFLAATEFLTYVFPYILLISLVAFLGAVQNSKKSFQVVAATPILFNLTLIVYACFSETLSLKVIGTAVIVAGIAQLLLNLYFTSKLGYFPSFTKKYNTGVLNSFFSRFFPAILAAGVYQLNVLVDTIFASFLISGSPTWLYLSDRLIQFPMGLFGVAIALVALPDLTEQLLNKNKKEFRKVFIKGFSSTFLLGLASGLFYIFLSVQIIQLLFFRGEFNMYDVEMTSLSLIAYAYALPFLLSSKFFNSVFFAANKTKLVLTLGLVSLILNLILNYVFIFVYDMGHVGLALATTFAAISVWVIAIIYLLSLKKSLTS